MTLGLPFFIKPCNAGSSYGIHCIEGEEGFAQALADAFYHDGKGKVILEKAIEGFEIGCAVMGNEEVIAGSVDEIEIAGSFFDYEGKYEMKDAAIYCPARIDEELFEAARDMAKRAYRAMNCSGMTRGGHVRHAVPHDHLQRAQHHSWIYRDLPLSFHDEGDRHPLSAADRRSGGSCAAAQSWG